MTYAEFKFGCTMTVLVHVYLGLDHQDQRSSCRNALQQAYRSSSLHLRRDSSSPDRSLKTIHRDAQRRCPPRRPSFVDCQVTHELDVIDGFAGAFGDPQAQSIEKDGTVSAAYLVTQ